MIYQSGSKVIDFNVDSIKEQKFEEFASNHKHLEMNDDELKQVYKLILIKGGKTEKPKVEAKKDTD